MKLLRNLIRHNGELLLLGRINAMKILLEKSTASPETKPKAVLPKDCCFMRGTPGLQCQSVNHFDDLVDVTYKF